MVVGFVVLGAVGSGTVVVAGGVQPGSSARFCASVSFTGTVSRRVASVMKPWADQTMTSQAASTSKSAAATVRGLAQLPPMIAAFGM